MGAKKEGRVIGEKFETLRILSSLTFEETAKLLLLKVEEIKKIREQHDNEISVKILYALYFFANVTLENKYKDTYDYSTAENLKKACMDELSRRHRNSHISF